MGFPEHGKRAFISVEQGIKGRLFRGHGNEYIAV